ncbi:MAG: precorrin-2 dehydrogenase/sirohydrochlorin ferrochelatase family protein [Acidimicrobiales bacterium]
MKPLDRAPRGYLVCWRLAGATVVVVGGGEVAAAKIEGLLGTGSRILVVSPDLTPRLAELADQGLLTWRPRRYRRGDFRGAALAVLATGDPRLQARLRGDAQRAGALVNAVDDPANCDVTIPAVVRRGPATVAISTDGHSPAAARFLREELDRLLPADLGELVALAGAARAELRAQGRYRYDYAAWRRGLFEPGWAALAQGRGRAALEGLASSFLRHWAPVPGTDRRRNAEAGTGAR